MSYLFVSGIAAIALAIFGASFVALSYLQEAWVGTLIVLWYAVTCVGLAVYFIVILPQFHSLRRMVWLRHPFA